MTAETGLLLMSSFGMSASISERLMRSLIALPMRIEADPVLVLEELADRAHAAVAEVVDVVDLALVVLQVDQVLHDLEDVLAGQRGLLERVRRARACGSACGGRPARGRSARR